MAERIRQLRAQGAVSPGVASALARATNGQLDVEMRDGHGTKCWWAPNLRIVAIERERGGNRLTLVLELDARHATDPRRGTVVVPPRPAEPPQERSVLVARGGGRPSPGEREAQRHEILRLSRDGLRPREIAARLGLSPQKVGSLVASNRSPGERRVRDEEIRRLAGEGRTQREIAERLGVSATLVGRVVGEGREGR